jgi:glycerate dehydrogenase
MKVLAHDVSQTNAPTWEPFRWADLDELFQSSDVVTLHCPQTDSNKGFVNAELLAKMKPTARLINAARGTLVNESDLAAALNAGKLAGACLDVVSIEPIRPDNPVLQAKNCLLTPHLAWAAVEARRRLMQTTADNIAAFQSGKPIHVVNP